ncbi:MAG TPA: hypothetical protein VHB98_13905, partial [Chloroflexota bacterium]|nr:hypothetical protein [Chloroflexota bacterium]
MMQRYNLADLSWTVSGWTPYLWQVQRSLETGKAAGAEVPPIPAPVPGSVQQALRLAGLLPDWNVGLQARDCEWVENRHWVYTVQLPDAWCAGGRPVRLRCLGLDYNGWVLLNGRQIGAFMGALQPHSFELAPALRAAGNVLHIVFALPPRWLGQFGYTSTIVEWKPRFNYTWDWTVRLVQLGIWDALFLEVGDDWQFGELACTTTLDLASGAGTIHLRAPLPPAARLRLALLDGAHVVQEAEYPALAVRAGIAWAGLPVA